MLIANWRRVSRTVERCIIRYDDLWHVASQLVER